MKKLIAIVLAVVCICSLSGCSHNDAEAMQLCIDGLNNLNAQNEYHYTSYTLEGTSLDAMVQQEPREYWLSNEDYLYFTQQGGIPIWTVSAEGVTYWAEGIEPDDLEWKLADGNAPAPSILKFDLSTFLVESNITQGDTRIITLIYDNSKLADGDITSESRLVIYFKKDNTIKEVWYTIQFSLPDAEGKASNGYLTQVTEYLEIADGGVAAKIQEYYHLAQESNN